MDKLLSTKVGEMLSRSISIKCGYVTHVSAEPWSKVSLLNGREKTQSDVSLAIPVLYPDGHGVKPKKVNDLQKMLPYMPEEHYLFYEDIHIGDENTSDND